MPAPAPPVGRRLKRILSQMGNRIRAHRKALGISAIATAEAAGISRMTLNRIERGEASVTMGAYLNVVSVLGLELELRDPKSLKESQLPKSLGLETKIKLSDYPQLEKLAWQIEKHEELSPEEALNIYERNWRHVELGKLSEQERELIQSLLALFNRERLLV